MKRVLVILSTPPYGTSNAHDGLDFAVAGTNFGHDIVVLFDGDGVWQLNPGQAPPKGTKHILKRITALPFYDIEELYACQPSLSSRLEHARLPEEIVTVTPHKKAELLQGADIVVRF